MEVSTLLKYQTDEEMSIAAETWGDPSAPPVLLMHGGGQTRHSWKDTGKSLSANGWHAIAYDARGHGDSEWSKAGNYGMDFLVSDLHSITNKCSQKPILVGASMGGLTSLVTLHRYPELAKALVLVDVSPKMEKKGINRIFQFMSAKPEGFENLEEVYEAVKAYLPNRKNIGKMEGLTKNLRKLPNGRYRWHWDPQLLKGWKNSFNEDQHKQWEEGLYFILKNLQIPTILIRGGMSDVVSKEGAQELVRQAPNLQYVDVAEAGHMVAGDSNHVFTEALLSFLKNV